MGDLGASTSMLTGNKEYPVGVCLNQALLTKGFKHYCTKKLHSINTFSLRVSLFHSYLGNSSEHMFMKALWKLQPFVDNTTSF